jgi:hypothetical protein
VEDLGFDSIALAELMTVLKELQAASHAQLDAWGEQGWMDVSLNDLIGGR